MASAPPVDAPGLLAAIAEQSVKDRLKANTDEVIRRGGFGSPTIFVDGTDMYFGNDRLGLVREALVRKRPMAPIPKQVSSARRTLEDMPHAVSSVV